MEHLLQRIRQASNEEIVDIYDAALKRYQELFPEWEITTVSIDRCQDRNTQIDRMITLLENMRN